MDKKSAHHTTRPLTPTEQDRVDRAIESVEQDQAAMRDEAREMKAASDQTAVVVQTIVNQLKAERQRQELTLADLEERSMLRISAVSRLETDPHSNPTLLTLQRYASALGCRIDCGLVSDEAAVK